MVVDDGTRQLRRGSEAQHLSPKAFDLLALLIHERPRAISKVELHARLWPNTFVSDASVAMLVAEVRAALGETARKPNAIRTLHRHGYAFQADARDVSGAGAVGDALVVGDWLVTSGHQFALIPGDIIVGRDPKATVWLDSPSVSRRHSRIRVEAGPAVLADLESQRSAKWTSCRGQPLHTAYRQIHRKRRSTRARSDNVAARVEPEILNWTLLLLRRHFGLRT